MKRIGNVTVREFEAFLSARGYSLDRINGGHRIWTKPGTRSIVVQSHIEPVPVPVIKCNLISIGASLKEFLTFLDGR